MAESTHSNSISTTTSSSDISFNPLRVSNFNLGPQGLNASELLTPSLSGDGVTYTKTSGWNGVEYDSGPIDGPKYGAYCGKVNGKQDDVWFGFHIWRDYTGSSFNDFSFSEGDEIWARQWIWMPSSFSLESFGTNPGWIKWFRTESPVSNSGHLDVAIRKSGGFIMENSEIASQRGEPENGQQLTSSTPLPRDQWVNMEWYIKLSPEPSVGIMRLYMNKILQIELNGFNLTDANQTFKSFIFNGNWNGNCPVDQHLWVDGFVITDQTSPPPQFGSDGSPIIGDWNG